MWSFVPYAKFTTKYYSGEQQHGAPLMAENNYPEDGEGQIPSTQWLVLPAIICGYELCNLCNTNAEKRQVMQHVMER